MDGENGKGTRGTIFVKSGTQIGALPQLIRNGCGRCGGTLSYYSAYNEYSCLYCSWVCYIEIQQDKLVDDIMAIARKVQNGTLSYGLGKMLYELSTKNGKGLAIIK